MKRITTLLFFTYIFTASLAQVTTPLPSEGSGEASLIGLDEARQLALEHNKKVQSARIQLSQTEYDMKAYRSLFFPRVNLMATDVYSNASGKIAIPGGQLPIYTLNPATGSYVPNVTPNADGSYTLNQYADFPSSNIDYNIKNVFIGGITLTQPIYMGGKISAAYRMATIGHDMAGENIRLSENDIIVRTDEAYYQAIRAHELAAVARSYQSLLKELEKNVESAVRHGLKHRNDQLKVQVKINEAELSVQRADNAYRLACLNLGYITGQPNIQPKYDDGQQSSSPSVSASRFSREETTASRPERILMSQKVALADQQVKLTRSEFLPQLALTGGYTYATGGEIAGKRLIDTGAGYVGFSLKVPVLTFGERANKIRSAKARHQMAELERADLNELLDLDLAQCRNNYDEAQTELTLTQQNLVQAEENLRLSRSQYDHGLEPLSDLLDAQALWQQASANLIEARCQLQLAHTRLLRAQGSSLR